jgi:hypothetical protein
MSRYAWTTQAQVRAAFWRSHPHLERKPGDQNKQVTDTRVAFVDFVDALARMGAISESLAGRVTL